MIKVIGLVGKKQSGKDSVCNEMLRLSANYKTKYPVYRIAFADEVYEEVRELFGAGDIDILRKNKNHPIVRHALQDLGSYRRNQNSSYWINIVERQINLHKPKYAKGCILLVITDVRHLNEAEYIKSQEGILIRIRRTATDSIIDTHESETNIDKIKCDNVIVNDWSIERLSKMTEDILNQYNLLS